MTEGFHKPVLSLNGRGRAKLLLSRKRQLNQHPQMRLGRSLALPAVDQTYELK